MIRANAPFLGDNGGSFDANTDARFSECGREVMILGASRKPMLLGFEEDKQAWRRVA